MSTEMHTPVTDGRRLRRERGRLTALDAMIDLVLEGHSPPTAEQIVDRAGISIATLFRYFETLEELRSEMMDRYFERYAHLFEIPDVGEGDRETRIAGFVKARARLHETITPMARLARRRAAEDSMLDEALHRVRADRAQQVRNHFAVELAALKPAERDDLVAILSSLTSFEAWDQMRHDHQRSPAQCRRAWSEAVTRLLTDARLTKKA